jgi:hypothetical protein
MVPGVSLNRSSAFGTVCPQGPSWNSVLHQWGLPSGLSLLAQSKPILTNAGQRADGIAVWTRKGVDTAAFAADSIWTEEEIAECQTPPVGDPALHQMVRPIVQHVAALTKGPQIFQSIVARITVQVRRGKYDARRPKPNSLHKIGPTSRTSTAIPPGRRLFIEPAPVGQTAEKGEMGSATALAPSAGAHEADVAAQFTPVRRIEGSQFRADWHGYATPFVPRTR